MDQFYWRQYMYLYIYVYVCVHITHCGGCFCHSAIINFFTIITKSPTFWHSSPLLGLSDCHRIGNTEVLVSFTSCRACQQVLIINIANMCFVVPLLLLLLLLIIIIIIIIASACAPLSSSSFSATSLVRFLNCHECLSEAGGLGNLTTSSSPKPSAVS